MTQTILIASDHAGYELKQHLMPFLQNKGLIVKDLGTSGPESVDYPDFGAKAARAILNKEAKWGVIICGTGIGISIAANRFKGVRAALCATPEMASLARQHNDANLLALGGRTTAPEMAEKIVEAFINARFEGDRHARRTGKMDAPDFC
jgi:ribose 5-phosphate isomerase B